MLDLFTNALGGGALGVLLRIGNGFFDNYKARLTDYKWEFLEVNARPHPPIRTFSFLAEKKSDLSLRWVLESDISPRGDE